MSDINNVAYLQHLYDKDDGEEEDDLQFILDAGSAVATTMSFAMHEWDREDQQFFVSHSNGGHQPGSKTKKRKRPTWMNILTKWIVFFSVGGIE